MSPQSRKITIRLDEKTYQKLAFLAEKSCRSIPRMARQMVLMDLHTLENLFGPLTPDWFLLFR